MTIGARKAALKRPRRAQLVCAEVVVLCPFCGETQPSPDNGSTMWTSENFLAKSGIFACVSCDERILISSEPKAQFE